MLNMVDNLQLTLLKNLRSGDSNMTVHSSDAVKLNAVGIGNHIYLTIKYGETYEIVKYNHNEDITAVSRPVHVPIIRDALAKGAKSFPRQTCVRADWNTLQLAEFICQTFEDC